MQADLQRRSYRLASPTAEELVVLVDGVPVGRLFVDRADAAISILDIALLPEQRGRGIGTRVIEGLQVEASRSGAHVRLQVEHGNAARRLYARLGFVEVGRDEFRSAMAWHPEVAA